MELAFRSEQGSSPRNEDCYRSLADQGLFLVCDGLSVKKGGDEAAKLAADAMESWVSAAKAELEDARKSSAKDAKKQIEEALVSAVHEASKRIFQRAATDPSFHGMCTGLDLVLLLGSHALVAHVGAGRIYLVRKREAHLLTEDHTQLAYLRRVGKLANASPQELANYARRVTRAVGFQEDVKVDTLLVELEPGDRFILMTDGVWQPLGDATVFSLAARPGLPEEVLGHLHDTVNETGARDNFTSLVLDPPAPAEPVPEGAAQKIKMLGKVPAFEYLSYQELVKVISAGDLVKTAAGQVLCLEGDAGGEMMLVLSGAADVAKGGKHIRRLGKGDVFGEMSMIDSAPRSATVTASSATNLLAFPRDALFALFREDPVLSVKFLWGVTTEMNKRLRAASNQLVGKPEQEGAAPSRQVSLPFHRSL